MDWSNQQTSQMTKSYGLHLLTRDGYGFHRLLIGRDIGGQTQNG